MLQSKNNIFIDLDGTILDVSERIYQLYKKILKKYNKKYLSKKEYIKLKREKVPVAEILAKTKAEEILQDFKKEWGLNIEKKEFLALDTLSPEIRKALMGLRKKYRLVMVALRENPENLKYELREKKLDKIFSAVLSKSGRGAKEKWKIKYNLVKKYAGKSGSVIIGDTETDILAGKKMGFKAIAVSNGMRNSQYLKKYKPDYLFRGIPQIKWNF